MTIFDTHILQ